MDSLTAKKDKEHLQLLTIFYYLMAGLDFIGLAFIGVHAFIMFFVMNSAELSDSSSEPIPDFFMPIMAVFYALFALLLIAGAILNLLAALDIRQHRRKQLTYVTAGINCLNAPLGTALGIFTFIVLNRPSVDDLYEARKNSTS